MSKMNNLTTMLLLQTWRRWCSYMVEYDSDGIHHQIPLRVLEMAFFYSISKSYDIFRKEVINWRSIRESKIFVKPPLLLCFNDGSMLAIAHFAHTPWASNVNPLLSHRGHHHQHYSHQRTPPHPRHITNIINVIIFGHHNYHNNNHYHHRQEHHCHNYDVGCCCYFNNSFLCQPSGRWERIENDLNHKWKHFERKMSFITFWDFWGRIIIFKPYGKINIWQLLKRYHWNVVEMNLSEQIRVFFASCPFFISSSETCPCWQP